MTVSPLYPGLELATTALAHLSGLTVVEAGMVLLGVVRMMFMLVLYLFYEKVGRSEQVGAIAALLYLGNSNFLYFDSQFSYESLSLPLATAVLYIVLLQQRPKRAQLFQVSTAHFADHYRCRAHPSFDCFCRG
ncbi:MAG: hypothetical protein ABI690_34285 [Chloroflexota bacterium]